MATSTTAPSSSVEAGHFRTGRYLHWPHQTPIEVVTPTGTVGLSGKPHQHLLVSAAQAMGLDDVDHVGLAEVEAQNGTRVSLTGGLPNLT